MNIPTGEAWSRLGLTNASVTKTYDPSLRLQTQQVAVAEEWEHSRFGNPGAEKGDRLLFE